MPKRRVPHQGFSVLTSPSSTLQAHSPAEEKGCVHAGAGFSLCAAAAIYWLNDKEGGGKAGVRCSV